MVDNARFFEINATVTGRRGELRPGNYTLPKGMSNGDAIDALTQGPEGRRSSDDRQRHAARGPVDPRGGAVVDKGGVRGQLR